MIGKTLLHTYQNGDFKVSIYDDGTKVREGDPFGSPIYPESIDLKLTDKCDVGCPWCHEKSAPNGEEANFLKMFNLLLGLPAGVELAIGGGNPFSYFQLEQFIVTMSIRGIICNVTVNERHFIPRNRKRLEYLVKHKDLHGIGYSYHERPCKWNYPNLVTHIIIGNTHPGELEKIVSPSKKVLLLGYKDYGHGKEYKTTHSEEIQKNIDLWYRYLPTLRDYQISMDNLAIKQLNPKRIFLDEKEYDKMYMGDDGTFTMYIDAVTETYAVSSTSEERIPWGNKTITEMFADVRTRRAHHG